MRTAILSTDVFTFEELSNEAQEKAIQQIIECNSPEYDWWDFMYEDAKTVGLKIKSFDCDRAQEIDIEFIYTGEDTANDIIENHGETCDTYKLAKQYLADKTALVLKYSYPDRPDIVHEDNDHAFDCDLDDLEEEFLRALGEEYLSMLGRYYDYLTSEEYAKESVSDFEFTIDGYIY